MFPVHRRHPFHVSFSVLTTSLLSYRLPVFQDSTLSYLVPLMGMMSIQGDLGMITDKHNLFINSKFSHQSTHCQIKRNANHLHRNDRLPQRRKSIEKSICTRKSAKLALGDSSSISSIIMLITNIRLTEFLR